MPKWLRKLKDELEEQGFRFQETRNGWQIFPPDKSKSPVVVHKTESDIRAEMNTLMRLKRAGFIIRRR